MGQTATAGWTTSARSGRLTFPRREDRPLSGERAKAVQCGDHAFVQEIAFDRGGDLLSGEAPEEESAVYQGQDRQLGIAGGGQLGQQLHLAHGAESSEQIASYGRLPAGIRGVAEHEALVAVGQLRPAGKLGVRRAAVADTGPAQVQQITGQRVVALDVDVGAVGGQGHVVGRRGWGVDRRVQGFAQGLGRAPAGVRLGQAAAQVVGPAGPGAHLRQGAGESSARLLALRAQVGAQLVELGGQLLEVQGHDEWSASLAQHALVAHAAGDALIIQMLQEGLGVLAAGGEHVPDLAQGDGV
jgi:hypothetical protein